ncbi:MAG: nucleotidyltransferase [Actinomycetota bacterium]|nr:nucleotidyltransferase [Actinomycetota bacterium]
MRPTEGGTGAAAEPPLRPLELLSELLRHGVDFVVIGGFSLAAHGVVRATKDVDIVPEPSEQNLARLMTAMQALEAEPLALGDFQPNELLELSVENLAAGGNWLLRTKLGRLDVMQYVHGMKSYADLRANAIVPKLPGVNPPPAFAGYEDLIAMKQAAGREQDLRDISELELARGDGGREAR